MPLTIACEEKSTKQSVIATENTTELVMPQKHETTETTQESAQKRETKVTETETTETATEETPTGTTDQRAAEQPPKLPAPKAEIPVQLPERLAVKELDGETFTISRHRSGMKIEGIAQKDLMITLFASWCPPCKGALPYLQDIQKRHSDDMFALGVLVNDEIDHDTLKHFLETYQVNFPVTKDKRVAQAIIQDLHLPSNYPLPLTILYHDGNYVIHYEGATPPEMIEHDIETFKDR